MDNSFFRNIKSFLFYFILVYMLNKNLWDFLSGQLMKYVYYLVLFGGAICGLYSIMRDRTTIPVVLFFSLYLCVIVFNAFTISNGDQRPVGLTEYLVYPLVFFAMVFYMDPRERYSGAPVYYMIWGGYTSLLALLEYFLKTPILPDAATRIYVFYDGSTAYRAVVFIGSPIILGLLLGGVLVCAIYYYSFKKRRIALIIILLSIIGILCTGSRAPLVSSVFGILMMFFLQERNSGVSTKVVLCFLLVFVIFLVVILVFSFSPNLKTGISFLDNIISRFGSTFDRTEWGNKERLIRWAFYLNQFTKKPVTGYGVASTSAEVLSNKNVTSHGITTESGVIGRLVETGLIGTIFFYAFLISLLIVSLGKLRKYAIYQISNVYYLVLGIVVLFIIDDFALQVSLDIFGNFMLWFFIAYGYNYLCFLDCRFKKRNSRIIEVQDD